MFPVDPPDKTKGALVAACATLTNQWNGTRTSLALDAAYERAMTIRSQDKYPRS